MISMTPRQRRRPSRRPPESRPPAAARFSAPCDRSWPGPAAPAPVAERVPDLETVRRHLEGSRTPGANCWGSVCELIHHFGCSRQEAEILVAERDAVQRARDAGLDPAPVRAQAEQLLREKAGR